MAGHNQPSYRAYMLRCWQERGRQEAQPSLWRFSLEDPRTGRRQGFASLAAVTAALERELADSPTALSEASEHITQNDKEDRQP